jgi:hypothetical protein
MTRHRPDPPALIAALTLAAALLHAPALRADAPRDTAAAAAAASVEGWKPDAELAPTTAVPWNLDRPAARAETWEHVVRFPGRVVTLPLSLMGRGLEAVLLDLETRGVIRYGPPPGPHPGNGFTIGPASLGDRTGFGMHVGGPPVPPAHWMRLDLSGSVHRYGRARLLLFKGPLGLEGQDDWRPREEFFGLGLQSTVGARSDMAVQSGEVRAIVAWPALHAVTRRDTLLARASHSRNRGFTTNAWLGSRTLVLRQGHEATAPPFNAVFPALAAEVDRRVEQLHWGAVARWDGRGGVPHLAHGSLLEARVDRLDRPVRALALGGEGSSTVPSTRITVSGETNVSFMRDPRTLRFSARASHLETAHGAGVVMLPDLASLGGSAGLAGYPVNRFVDRDLLLGRVAYVFPLAELVEFELRAEAGGVYGDLRHDPRLSTFRHSWGAHLRPRGPGAPIGSFGVDWSREGTRVTFSFGGVE